jgi:hypothetical protein
VPAPRGGFHIAALVAAGVLIALCGPANVSAARADGGRSVLASSELAPDFSALLIQNAKLSGGTEAEGSLFGYSVALSADGDTALIGGKYASGAAWVFTRSGKIWTQEGPPLAVTEEDASECAGEAGECQFGRSVALSADGNTALIGGATDNGSRGAVWVFTRSGSTWTPSGKLTGGEEESGAGRFGRSLALSADGGTALVAAPKSHAGTGAVWVFTQSEGTWGQQGSVLVGGEEEVGPAHFGSSVALSESGNTALIGARMDDGGVGAVWAFTRSGGSWSRQGPKLTGGEESGEGRFGSSIALSAFGGTALIGGRGDDGDTGAAWVFTRSGATWAQQGPKLTGGEESGEGEFGASVSLSANGEVAAVGAPLDSKIGAAWMFTRSGGSWSQEGTKLPSPEPGAPQRFGTGLALSGDGRTLLVGGPAHRHDEGAAWAFENKTVPAPTVTSVSPESGSIEGGTLVTITGTGFVPGAKVEIGGVAASPVEVLSESELTAVAPAHGPGPVQVLVSTPDGESSGGPTYTYVITVPPTISSITPTSGPSEGGTSVKITGSGFVSGSSTVKIGGEAASSVEVLSETELTAVTPAHAAGSAEVAVSTPNGETTGGPTYEYLSAPAVPTLTPTITAPLGGSPLGSTGVLSSHESKLPPPKLGISGNLYPVSGTVRVKLPGSKKFILLSEALQVPFGTIVDAREGKVTLTTEGPHGQLQSMSFYEGEFKITQKHGGRVFATLKGGDFASCPTRRERGHIASAQAASAGKRPVRKLWASGHGSYSTKGNYAAGAVLGTVWLTEDFCNGTYIHVATDSVEVTNLVTHRDFLVKAGHSYFAKAP